MRQWVNDSVPGSTALRTSPSEIRVNDYDLLRNYLKKQKLPEFVLTFAEIEEIIDAALPRASHRASWWETLRSPQEKMPQREACLDAGYMPTRHPHSKTMTFQTSTPQPPPPTAH